MPNITAYRQLESSDCGITCIRIIAKFYGKNIPLKYLREKCDSSRIGISLKDITTCTESLGFKTTALKVPVKNAIIIYNFSINSAVVFPISLVLIL